MSVDESHLYAAVEGLILYGRPAAFVEKRFLGHFVLDIGTYQHQVGLVALADEAAIADAEQGLNPWVWKWDAGAESYTEKEKGEASDSFKRACVNWGIGRELYTAPLIFIRAKTDPVGNGYRLSDKRDGYGYKVAQIEYEGGRISHLVITKNGTQVFTFTADEFMEQAQTTIDEKMAQMVLTMAENAKCKSILNDMGFSTPADVKKMTMQQYSDFARRCNE